MWRSLPHEQREGVWGNREVPPRRARRRGLVGETWFPPRERARGERRSHLERHEPERVDVDEAVVRDLQARDHREREERERLERRRQRAAEPTRRLYTRAARRDDLGEWAIGEETRNRERKLRSDLAVRDDDDAAAELEEPLDRALQVVVAHPDGDDVVRVVRDRRGERAFAQPEAAHEAEA